MYSNCSQTQSTGQPESLDNPSHTFTRQLNPITRVILQGLCDESSPLSKLNWIWVVLKKIWKHVTDFCKASIKIAFDAGNDNKNFLRETTFLNLNSTVNVPIAKQLIYRAQPYLLGELKFPEPTGIRIDMMPFIMDGQDFGKCFLPDWSNIFQYC